MLTKERLYLSYEKENSIIKSSKLPRFARG